MAKATLVDACGIFGTIVVLLVATAVASASRRRDRYTDLRSKCGIASSQIDDTCRGSANVNRHLFFRDVSMSTAPDAENVRKPYFFGKVIDGGRHAALALAVHDDDALGTTGRFEVSTGFPQHAFQEDGVAIHTDRLTVGSEGTAGVGTLNVGGTYFGAPTSSAKANRLSGKTGVIGNVGVDGDVHANAGGQAITAGKACIDTTCVTPGAVNKILGVAAVYEDRMSGLETSVGTNWNSIYKLEADLGTDDVPSPLIAKLDKLEADFKASYAAVVAAGATDLQSIRDSEAAMRKLWVAEENEVASKQTWIQQAWATSSAVNTPR